MKGNGTRQKTFPSLSVAALCFWTYFQHRLLSFKNVKVYFDVKQLTKLVDVKMIIITSSKLSYDPYPKEKNSAFISDLFWVTR